MDLASILDAIRGRGRRPVRSRRSGGRTIAIKHNGKVTRYRVNRYGEAKKISG